MKDWNVGFRVIWGREPFPNDLKIYYNLAAMLLITKACDLNGNAWVPENKHELC